MSKQNKVAYFDLSGTLVPGYFISVFYIYFAEHFIPQRLEEVIRRDTEIVQGMRDGTIDYNKATVMVIDMFAELVKGRTVAEISAAAAECFKAKQPFLFVAPLFKYLLEQGFKLVIITADFEFMIRSVIDRLPKPFNVYGSELEIENGFFTGKILKINNHDIKLETIRKIETQDPGTMTVAFGDSEGDLAMLKAVDLGFMLQLRDNGFAGVPQKKNEIVYIANNGSVVPAREIQKQIEMLLNK